VSSGDELIPTPFKDDIGPDQVFVTKYLYPGQMFVSSAAAKVTTILGSCVAVCLWDATAGVGGINHYLLPTNPRRDHSDLRYGNTAIAALVEAMLSRGASSSRMAAQIVGGACVLEAFGGPRRSIGDQNTFAAREFFRLGQIKVDIEKTGGRRGRKLVFHTSSGSATVKEI
jgi:chemotaxis protein CheD